MPGWKAMLTVAILFVIGGQCPAAEIASTGSVDNALLTADLKRAQQHKEIREITEKNVQDILSVPSDIADLAQIKGRDFGYSPVSPSPAKIKETTVLTHAASGWPVRLNGDQSL